MGLLDKLWDDSVGGPQPDKGVGKLRKLDIPMSPRFARQDSGSMDSPRAPDSPAAQYPSSDSFMKTMLDRRNSAELQRQQDEAKRVTQSISISKPAQMDRAASLPSSFSGSPGLNGIPSPATRKEDNIWRSVFHPGSNKAGMDRVGSGHSGRWDHAEESAPSVYDWMYHPKSKHNYR